VEELVIDASALVDALTDNSESALQLAERISEANLHAPDHLFVESAHAIKNLSARLPAESTQQAFDQLREIEVDTLPFTAFAELAWRHRHNLSLYDAGYLAVAMMTGFPLVTSDRRLASVAKNYVDVIEPPQANTERP
jgi:predicted nucleic acid-binding protein